MLEKEIERAGIPCTLITTLIPAAITVGANRIVPGKAIVHPLGDPHLSPGKEKTFRRTIVAKALETLGRQIEKEYNV